MECGFYANLNNLSVLGSYAQRIGRQKINWFQMILGGETSVELGSTEYEMVRKP